MSGSRLIALASIISGIAYLTSLGGIGALGLFALIILAALSMRGLSDYLMPVAIALSQLPLIVPSAITLALVSLSDIVYIIQLVSLARFKHALAQYLSLTLTLTALFFLLGVWRPLVAYVSSQILVMGYQSYELGLLESSALAIVVAYLYYALKAISHSSQPILRRRKHAR